MSSRTEFLEMIDDPKYRDIGSEDYRRDHEPVRAAVLCDSRLIETTPR